MLPESPTKPPTLRVHLISGSDEYRSDDSLPLLASQLGRDLGADCTLSLAGDRGACLPDWPSLLACDVLVVFCRRVNLPDEQRVGLQDWCESGRGIVGIRTASHAFQNWPEFDRVVLGGDYRGHGREETVRVDVEPGVAEPVPRGLDGWSRLDKVYDNPGIATDARVLLRCGDGSRAGMPMAWRRHTPAGTRVFYSSIGHPADFEHPAYMALLTAAVGWAGGARSDNHRTAPAALHADRAGDRS